MRLGQSRDVREILLPFAGPALGIAPGQQLALQGVFQTGEAVVELSRDPGEKLHQPSRRREEQTPPPLSVPKLHRDEEGGHAAPRFKVACWPRVVCNCGHENFVSPPGAVQRLPRRRHVCRRAG